LWGEKNLPGLMPIRVTNPEEWNASIVYPFEKENLRASLLDEVNHSFSKVPEALYEPL